MNFTSIGSPITHSVLGSKVAPKTMRDVYHVLFRHQANVLLFFFSVLLAVVTGTFLAPRIYKSDAEILIKLGRQSAVIDPTVAASGQVVSVQQNRETEVNSEMIILQSQEMAERVVTSVGADRILEKDDEPVKPMAGDALLRATIRERDQAVRTVMQSVKIEALPRSNIIALSYESQDPKLSQQVLNTLIEAYQDKHISAHWTPGSYEFFLQQTEQVRQALLRTENQLLELKNRLGISSVEDQQRTLRDQYSYLRQQVEGTDSSVAASKAKVDSVRAQLAKFPETMTREVQKNVANQAYDYMRQDLFRLQLKQQEILSIYKPDTAQAKEIARQVAEAEKMLKEQASNRTQTVVGTNPIFMELTSSLVAEETVHSALVAKRTVLGTQMDKLMNDFRDLNEFEYSVKNLEREKDVLSANYSKYKNSLEEARIDEALKTQRISSISIVQEPSLPVRHVKPRMLRNLAAGLVLAVIGSLALAFILEYLDHTVNRPEDVEYSIMLPVLLDVPARFFKAESCEAPGAPPGEGGGAGRMFRDAAVKLGTSIKEQFAGKPEPPRTPESRAYARVHTERFYDNMWDRLFLKRSELSKPPRSIAVTASYDGEGVSTVAANLAISLAKNSREKVLLIDANLGSPCMQEVFCTLGDSHGLSDLIAGRTDYVEPVAQPDYPRLWLLPAGGALTGDDACIDPRYMEAVVGKYRDGFGYIVIDCPAVWRSNVPTRIATVADGVILVVEAERVRVQIVERTKERLEEVNARILGVVLNKRRFYIPSWLYRQI
ncbi:GumC family protein [Fundidesulfovibrio terrae]|uniref:GumC family protein n=1 Tax=Fundidesulfovibrio terrae TaxID=2922866 RepID=UPI001FAF0FEB|nr:polysaccharide biosynthesis tyrosine autokinase [Fundidesulfovibrio terrae]